MTYALENGAQPALEANLLQLKQELIMQGVPAIDPAEHTMKLFARSSPEVQQGILQNIASYLQVLSQDPMPQIERRDYEIERLRLALRAFRLDFGDPNFLSKIGENDVIEVYNENNIQLYRSVKFFKLCSYSLLDLSINPWDELYDKPAGVMSEVLTHIDRAKGDMETVSCSIGSFLQREKFKYAKQLRTFLVNFRYFSPLVDIETRRCAGFVCTFTADILAEGDQSHKFSVL